MVVFPQSMPDFVDVFSDVIVPTPVGVPLTEDGFDLLKIDMAVIERRSLVFGELLEEAFDNPVHAKFVKL